LFPKAHATSHAFDDVLQKGALLHVSTKPGEKHHGSFREIYLASNKKRVDQQVHACTHPQLSLNLQIS
jgi:hypothetical protein